MFRTIVLALVMPSLALADEPKADVTGSYSYTTTVTAISHHVDKKMRLDGFVRLFNVFDQQDELKVDQNYTYEPANPIIDGDAHDLEHIKAIDETGQELGRTVVRNKNFGHTKIRQAPRSVQIGVRWLF